MSSKKFSDQQRDSWNSLNSELDELDETIKERQVREARLRSRVERGDNIVIGPSLPPHVESRATDGSPPHVTIARDQALRTIDRHKNELTPSAGDALTDTIRKRDPNGVTARYFAAVGEPSYGSAFGKLVMDPQHGHLRFTPEEVEAMQRVTSAMSEQRGLSLTGASGGLAVPFALDPTIVPTSNGVANPIREVARIEQIGVDEWRGVSSAGITASYAAESTETTDNAPTLVQPTISTEKAQAFVPFTIEVGQDWGSLQQEMGRLLQDAKDTLEAQKFINGSGTNEPFGVITGTTNTVNASAGQTFTAANVFALQEALPARYQPRAVWMGDLAILNDIVQFESTNGSKMFEDMSQGRLLRRPFYEASEMADSPATGNKFLLYGDFSRYVIVDRVGLTIELVPHLIGTNHRPKGERGLYCYWRNGAKLIDANATRALIGVA